MKIPIAAVTAEAVIPSNGRFQFGGGQPDPRGQFGEAARLDQPSALLSCIPLEWRCLPTKAAV